MAESPSMLQQAYDLAQGAASRLAKRLQEAKTSGKQIPLHESLQVYQTMATLSVAFALISAQDKPAQSGQAGRGGLSVGGLNIDFNQALAKAEQERAAGVAAVERACNRARDRIKRKPGVRS